MRVDVALVLKREVVVSACVVAGSLHKWIPCFLRVQLVRDVSLVGVVKEIYKISLGWVRKLDWSQHALVHLQLLVKLGLGSIGKNRRLVLYHTSSLTTLQSLAHTNVPQVVDLNIEELIFLVI